MKLYKIYLTKITAIYTAFCTGEYSSFGHSNRGQQHAILNRRISNDRFAVLLVGGGDTGHSAPPRLVSSPTGHNLKCANLNRHPVYLLRTLLVIVTLCSTQFTYALVTGPGAAWQYVRKITLSAATPAANFQVKVTLSAGQYGNMNAAGNDLRFYDINNNVCNYWLETWNTSGTSTIWVKVVTNGANALFMYYGNAAAPAASDGTNVFEFFDDFTTALGATWTQVASGGTVTQSGTTVTLANTGGASGNAAISNSSPFSPVTSSFMIETKHQEGAYNRNRFYATTGVLGGSPTPFDYGYFSTVGTAATSAQIFWNGFPGSNTVNAGTDYLTQWRITDGSTYNWFTYNYSTGATVTNGSRTTTLAATIRYITIQVTEVASTSTIVDWVRVRKANSSFSDPVATVGSQVSNLSATITSQTNVICTGQSTGSATVTATGGSAPYTYSWNSSPTQTTQTATNLPVGSYIVTVNDNIGLTTTASVTITLQPVVKAIATYNNINCFNANDGTITITGSNGAAPYMFSINNGGSYQSSNTFTNLSPGAYKPRVKDNNGCESKSVQ